MTHDPWTLFGWMLCAIVAFVVVAAPVAVILLVRFRARVVREREATRARFFAASRRARAEWDPTQRTRGG